MCSIVIPWLTGHIVQDEKVVRGVLASCDQRQMAHGDLSPGSWLERIWMGAVHCLFLHPLLSSIMYLGPMHLDR